MPIHQTKYGGLKRRSNYEEELDYLLYHQEHMIYPDRAASQILKSPYMTQFHSEHFNIMSEQDKKRNQIIEADARLKADTAKNGGDINKAKADDPPKGPPIDPRPYDAFFDEDSLDIAGDPSSPLGALVQDDMFTQIPDHLTPEIPIHSSVPQYSMSPEMSRPSPSASAASASDMTLPPPSTALFQGVEREQSARIGPISKEFVYADLKSVPEFLDYIRSTQDPLFSASLVAARAKNIQEKDPVGYKYAEGTMRSETTLGDFRAKYPKFKVSKSTTNTTLDERKYTLWLYDRKASSKR